jgi:hypothetical protein
VVVVDVVAVVAAAGSLAVVVGAAGSLVVVVDVAVVAAAGSLAVVVAVAAAVESVVVASVAAGWEVASVVVAALVSVRPRPDLLERSTARSPTAARTAASCAEAASMEARLTVAGATAGVAPRALTGAAAETCWASEGLVAGPLKASAMSSASETDVIRLSNGTTMEGFTVCESHALSNPECEMPTRLLGHPAHDRTEPVVTASPSHPPPR